MLNIQNVHKEYRTGDLVQKALDGVSLSFREKEFVAILGPSGSGKTTLLNIIGGLDRYDTGEMSIDGISTVAYKDRDWDTYRNHTIGFIFQSYNLIPHQSLLSNVELAMTLSGVSRKERRIRALEALEKVGLKEQAWKKPSQLSGGQMQRVALARALVNRPSVLLADEPTGALDSETGKQVMELLKEVAADHLVIMVTHNAKLAKKYATRIVHLKDGRITKDTDPYEEQAEGTAARAALRKHGSLRKPSMSFLTALSLSVANLLSKRARTALVAFAASIGITGIALILSLSNGANSYIRRMEQESLSEYPIEITTSSFSMENTMMALASMRSEAEAPADSGSIQEQQFMGGMLASAAVNDLASLKRWFDSGLSGMEDYTRGIACRYGISPQIYLKEAEGYRQVNPDQTMNAFGLSVDENLSGMMAAYSANEVFYMLPENPDLYLQDYTLLAGTWPNRDTDCVLVLTSSGNIPDFLLYTMGLKDARALNTRIEDVMAGQAADTGMQAGGSYRPEDFLGISFRLFPAWKKYIYDEKLSLWVDQSGDEAWLADRLDQAEQMRIVGVVRPAEGVSFGILEVGIQYPAGMLRRLMSEAEDSRIVREQLADPEMNVLTGVRFGEQIRGGLDMLTDIVSFHPEKLSETVSFQWDQLSAFLADRPGPSVRQTVQILRELTRTGSSPTLSAMVDSALPLLMDFIHFDPEKLNEVITFEMDEAHLREMMAAQAAAQSATLEANLTRFGYASSAKPIRISIYPNDFESKKEALRLLDAYNAAMKAEGYNDKVITYTDYVGALMETVTTIVDVITYVLIAFVAVSLLVSSIMIGIITYISVLERRKEIGILRAMGASRHNITQVFNAETFIIGILAGALGIGITLLAQIPINHIIRTLSGQEGIRAFLPSGAAGILILLCVLLTLIGGFIPARKAARQDPVTALRSDG